MQTRIPVQHQRTITVTNGELVIKLVQRDISALEYWQEAEWYEVEYRNNLFVGSPFKMPITFGTCFTPHEIAHSSEVYTFLRRFR